MEDFADEPRPSIARPILYGAAIGFACIAIFFVAYVIAPDIGYPGTFAIAAALAAAALMLANFAPTRANQEVTALVLGEDPAPATPRLEGKAKPASSPGAAVDEQVARVDKAREEWSAIDRAAQPVRWMDGLRTLADETMALAALERSFTDGKRRRAGLGHYRQASSIYRRVVNARGKNSSERSWATAQLAFAECLLLLGEAQSARDEVLEAVNAFTAGLEVADLSPEERAVGENGLARAEGVLAGMADEANAIGGEADLL